MSTARLINAHIIIVWFDCATFGAAKSQYTTTARKYFETKNTYTNQSVDIYMSTSMHTPEFDTKHLDVGPSNTHSRT